jgi:hypothetical protein
MTATDARLRTLRMIEEGTITAAEGARLLTALEEPKPERRAQAGDPLPPRWFRVRISDLESGQSRVNVSIPLGLVDVGLKMGARFAPDIEGFDFSELAEALGQGVQGKILDAVDAEDGERVEIYVE